MALANAQWSPYADLPVPLPDLPVTRLLGRRIAGPLVKGLTPLVFRMHTKPFNNLRRSYGLDPLSSLQEIYTHGTETLYMDIPDLFDLKDLPRHHHYIGPIHGSSVRALPDWWGNVPSDKPVIFVSPGSSGDGAAMAQVIDALRTMDVTPIIVDAGNIDRNVIKDYKYHKDYIPGLLAAARADVVISNGGSGMTYMALSQGTPVLSIPSLMDQCYVAEAVARKGAGLALHPGAMTLHRIRKAVDCLFQNPEFSKNAQHFQTKLQSCNPIDQFNHIMRQLISHKQVRNTG
jgi:UDP:flavonoid glycosyltransferase YjiC (YdhE family)